MTKSSKNTDYLTQPTPQTAEYYIRRGRQLRAQFFADMFRRAGQGIVRGWRIANRPWQAPTRSWSRNRTAH